MDLKSMKVSPFAISYMKKFTFSRYSFFFYVPVQSLSQFMYSLQNVLYQMRICLVHSVGIKYQKFKYWILNKMLSADV